MERKSKKLISTKKLWVFSLLLCISCSTMERNIQKNNKKTDKIISSLFEKHGNVFYLRSSHTTISTVWFYKKDSIEIYNLAKGKLGPQQKYSTPRIDTLSQISNIELFELDKCMELDGDIFGYRIKRSSGIEKYDLPIGIDCFTRLKYKSYFLNKVAEDIKTYKMWNVQYR